ncbi:MAG: hypothetical protein IPK16_06935 [Anaerolineales bacterium]|nr:hypothetical protein [Anaerolineales bacterium]
MASASKTAGKLGLIPATALVIGNLIGSGIFLLPASLAPFGGLALVALVICPMHFPFKWAYPILIQVYLTT